MTFISHTQLEQRDGELERLRGEMCELDKMRQSLEGECKEGRMRVRQMEMELERAHSDIRHLQQKVCVSTYIYGERERASVCVCAQVEDLSSVPSEASGESHLADYLLASQAETEALRREKEDMEQEVSRIQESTLGVYCVGDVCMCVCT